MTVPSALAECLASYQVKHLPLPKHLVTLEHPKHKLFDAIRLLSQQHLLSAPVLDEKGQLLGTLDTLDIVAYVVEAEAEGKGRLLDKHIDGIMGKVSNAVHTVSPEDNLADVVNVIAGPARRAVVLGADGSPESVITQSTVIQFLHEKKLFHGRRHRWLAKELCTASAFVISADDTALKAFQKLIEKKVSSLVILDEDGHALTTVSTTDLVQAIGRMEDMSAALSILQTANVVQLVGESRSSHTRAAVISASPDAPMTEIIEKLAVTRVHRLVIIGEDRTPLGVLSLSDICHAVCEPGVESLAAGGA
eukprot:TRINITY_DN7324_c0_g1_i1.p1 TRINITY_DN7324_c0_g1~~TRINITY_DN7324_c0_g1_i1.p1  ORF type:complete len:307 (-),score=55.53 TRINITY_DN7324_c0_g1_i1:188-1108(-)